MPLDNTSLAFDQATKQLKAAGNDIDLIPKAVATFLLVYSAHGVIGNGGYKYFFESDWPKNPPYQKFIDAYKEIGCESQAKDLSRVVSTFPFNQPHLNEEARNEYMDANFDDDKYEVKGWGDALCGDDEVWKKLDAYYLQNIIDSV